MMSRPGSSSAAIVRENILSSLAPYQARLNPQIAEEILSHPLIPQPRIIQENGYYRREGGYMQAAFRMTQFMMLAAIKFAPKDDIATPEQRRRAAAMLTQMKP